MNTFELNSIRKDADYGDGQIKKTSPVVEIFSALAQGKDLSKWGAKADAAVAHIKSLGEKAAAGNQEAVSELNALRRFAIEPLLLEEVKLLGLFGNYQSLAYGDSIEREVSVLAGEKSRIQAPNGDVTFPSWVKDKYAVAPITVSGGYMVDYRAIALGDMAKENIGMEQVRIDVRNQAALYVVKVLYAAIKNATGVKYWAEASGIAQASLDNIVKSVRRFGQTSIVGSYAAVSQVNSFAGWSDGTAIHIADAALEEIRRDGLVGSYKGSMVREIPNPFNLTETTGTGASKNFVPLLPDGLLFVIPTGVESPVMTWTRGGLTSLTGTDVTTGKIITRFDLEVAADVAQGQEYKIGLMNDTALSPASGFAI